MAKNYFDRYVWLIATIRMHAPISLAELNRRWKECYINNFKGEERGKLSNRTFHNHQQAIEDMFGIVIKYSQTQRGYVLEDYDNDPTKEYKNWMLDCIGINTTLKESSYIRNKILVEEVPSNQQWLSVILSALSSKHCICLTYKSFQMEEATTFEAHPYCIKLFKQRWYLLAKSKAYNEPHIYSLDRIENVEILDKKSKVPVNFNAYDFFLKYFGIIIDSSQKAEIVKLRVDAEQVKYFESLPWHPTQKRETKEEEKFKEGSAVFSYYLVPTYDLKQEILRHGSSVEVLSPIHLRKEIKQEIAAMAKRYR